MPRPATGELRPTANGFEARIRIDDAGTRRGFAIPMRDELVARERCTALAQIAVRLRRAGHEADVPRLLETGARTRYGKAWDAFLAAVDAVCSGDPEPPLVDDSEDRSFVLWATTRNAELEAENDQLRAELAAVRAELAAERGKRSPL